MAYLVSVSCRRRQHLLPIVLASLSAPSVYAVVIVNPPLPIERRVRVQIIQTALDDGSQPATVFGDASQQADIMAVVDQVWAQASIDIEFLPTVNRYNDTFAFQGNGGTRPSGDLGVMISQVGQQGGILNQSTQVINMFFDEVTPGFGPKSEGVANGLAYISGNGISQFTGENLLQGSGGRDSIAKVTAHEIGHNLGLTHTANGIANLMSPGGSSFQLDLGQINTVLGSTFLEDVTAVGADFTGDGNVDEEDLALWDASFAVGGAADSNGDGQTNGADLMDWQRQVNYCSTKALRRHPDPRAGDPSPADDRIFLV